MRMLQERASHAGGQGLGDLLGSFSDERGGGRQAAVLGW